MKDAFAKRDDNDNERFCYRGYSFSFAVLSEYLFLLLFVWLTVTTTAENLYLCSSVDS